MTKVRATVLFLDHVWLPEGYTIDPNGLQLPAGEVWVLRPAPDGGSFKDIIGSASLVREGNEIVADMRLLPTAPREVALYPSIEGKVLRKEDGKVTESVIDRIIVHPTKNSDERIVPFLIKEPTRATLTPYGVREWQTDDGSGTAS